MTEPIRLLLNICMLKSPAFKKMWIFFFGLFFFFSSNTVFAQISSDFDGNWNSPVTWNLVEVPSSSDNVIIGNTVTIPAGTTAEAFDLTINNTLYVEGTLIVYGSLYSGNNSELIAVSGSSIFIFGDANLANQVSLDLSSYFVVKGDLNKDGSHNKGTLSIADARIYVFGSVNVPTDNKSEPWQNFSVCPTGRYDGTTATTGDECDAGQLDDFTGNVDPDDLPDGVYEEIVGCTEPIATISLSSASGTDNQTVNITSGITPVTYVTTGATGAAFSGLPAGINGNWASDEVVINGAPTEPGIFNYTIELTGGCGTVTVSGIIAVNNTFDVFTESPGQICNGASGQITDTESDVATPVSFTVNMATGNAAWSPDWQITFSLIPGNDGVVIENVSATSGSLSGTGPYILTGISGSGGIGTVSINMNVTGNIYSDVSVLLNITSAVELQYNTMDKDEDDWVATQSIKPVPNTSDISTN